MKNTEFRMDILRIVLFIKFFFRLICIFGGFEWIVCMIARDSGKFNYRTV